MLSPSSDTRELPGNAPYAAKLAMLQAFRRTWGASALACFDAIQAEFEASVAALVREHYAGLSSA